MKSKLLLALYFIFSSFYIIAQEKVTVFYQNESAHSPHNFDKFIFTHNIFSDAFYRTDLYKQLDSQEMAEITETVRQKISTSNAIKFEINQKTTPNATLTFSIESESKDGAILIMFTNFDQTTRKFTEKSEEHLVRWYFIKEDKIIYRKDLFSKDTEESLIKQNKKTDLISLYLFDELSENDNKAKKIIDEILNDPKSTEIEILYAYLYSQEYFLSKKDYEQAKKSNKALNDFFDKNIGKGIPENYGLIKKMANTEFEIMNLI